MNLASKVTIMTAVLWVFASVSVFSYETGWTAIDPVPHPRFAGCLYVESEDSIWGAGPVGEIFHMDNGTWKLHNAQSVNFHSIHGFNDNSVIAVGKALNNSYGVVMKWDGISWRKILEAPGNFWKNGTLRGIWGHSSDEFFVCGKYGGFYKYSHGSWQKIETGTTGTLTGMWGSGPNDLYIVGVTGDDEEHAGIIMHWNGTDLDVVFTYDGYSFSGVWGYGTDYIIAVGLSGIVVEWDGFSWERQSEIPDVEMLNSVWGTSKDNLYIAGHGSIIHKQDDTWTEIDTGHYMLFGSIHGTSSGEVFTVGYSAYTCRLLKLEDDSWKAISTEALGGFMDITGNGTDQIFAVGWIREGSSDAKCLISQWNGISWTDIIFEEEGVLNAVYTTSPDSAFAVGSTHFYSQTGTGIIVRWDGIEWTVISSEYYGGLQDVIGFSPNEYYAVGNDGLMLEWKGSEWIPVGIPISDNLINIWGTSSTNLFVSAKGTDHRRLSRIYHWNGIDWRIIYENERMDICDILGFSDTDDLFALVASVKNRWRLKRWDGNRWWNVGDVGSGWAASRNSKGKLFGFDAEDMYLILDCFSTAYDDHIYHFDGTTLEVLGSPLLKGYTSVWGADRSRLLFVGHNHGFMNRRFIVEYKPDKVTHAKGVRLTMPYTDLQFADPFAVTGYLDNPGSPMSNVPVFFILDIHGSLFFWPSWINYSPPDIDEIDFKRVDVPTGTTKVTVFPAFSWPDLGYQSLSDLYIYGAMLNESMDSILGDLGVITFGYSR